MDIAKGRTYYVMHDVDRAGWCIFIKDSELISRFVAGRFESKEHAESEAFRLNEKIEH